MPSLPMRRVLWTVICLQLVWAGWFLSHRPKDHIFLPTSFGCHNLHQLPESNDLEIIQKLRAYGQCLHTSQCMDHLLPFKGSPRYTRFDGTRRFIPSQKCFWPTFSKQWRGRGIVMSVGDGPGVSQTIRLLHVLQHVNNTLPIEIVHKGDLSPASSARIAKAARSTRQNVWMVDAATSVTDHLRFQSFANKWIAVLMSLFEEMIFMDSDAVVFVNPAEFLEMYNGNALFFQDRYLDEHLKKKELELIKQLVAPFPSFNISSTHTNGMLTNGSKHVMESGLVVMNRTATLPGLLVLVRLQNLRTLAKSVYGDKELFWLGQVIAGNDGFKFNKHYASAIGKVAGGRVCLSQTAHFSDRLLWVNGGLSNCKRANMWDFLKHPSLRRQHESIGLLYRFYDEPIEVEVAAAYNDAFAVKDRSLGCGGRYYCTTGEPRHFSQDKLQEISQVVEVWNTPVV